MTHVCGPRGVGRPVSRLFWERETQPNEGDTRLAPGSVVLHREMTQLKSEVRMQVRQFKDGLQQFTRAFNAIDATQRSLAAEQEVRNQMAGRLTDLEKRQLLKPLLLDWVEMCDKLFAERAMLESFNPGWASRAFSKETKLLQSLVEGRELLLTRLQQQLSSHGVEPIQVIDQTFDGRFMKVGEVVDREDLSDGAVVAVLIPGYTWRDEVLRLAEVSVNRKGGSQDGE